MTEPFLNHDNNTELEPQMQLERIQIEKYSDRSPKIFEGLYLPTHTPVIIKRLDYADQDYSPELKRSLQMNEIMLLQRAHPMAPEVLYAAMGDWPFIAMQSCRSVTLSEYIGLRKEGIEIDFPETEALSIARKVAEALHFIYLESEIIHCDLKPANILLLMNKERDVQLIDFGMAKSERFGLDITQMRGCTPRYAAPECAGANWQPSITGDIYSLGIVLFEMASKGKALFNDSSTKRLFYEKCSGKAEFKNNVSPILEKLISRMLGVNGHTRISSYEELYLEIDDTERSLELSVPTT